jgi:mono/diheme cytochrome c family protein
MWKSKWSGAAAAVAVLAFVACGDAAPDAAPTPDAPAPGAPGTPAPPVGANIDLPEGVTSEMVQQGKTIFETSTCHTCHAMDGSGTALAPSLRDQDWLNSDGSFDGIMSTVRNGVAQPVRYPGAMPPMGGANLSEDQIRAVSGYIYAISHGG